VKMSVNCDVVRTCKKRTLTDDNLLSDKIKIKLHMLGALMLNGVGGEVHGVDIITVDTETAGSGARGAADTARWPQPRRWQRHDTRPQCWSKR
jgi:hypothetical protein